MPYRVKLPGGKVRWEARWREGANKQRSRRFDLKRDAEAWESEVRRRKQLGPIAVRQLTVKGPTLADWIETRWAPEHGSTLAVKTLDRYSSAYQLHVEPYIGHLPLQELTVGRLREWQTDRLRAGVTPDAVHKARTVLSTVLRHAAESEVIQGNPMQYVRKPKAAYKDDVIALSPREIEKIRTLLRPRDATIVSVLAYTGMRPGELRVLRWGDIREATIYLQRAADPDGTAKATKTKRGRRTIDILPAVKADLAAWRARQKPANGQALVFPAKGGLPLTETGFGDWRSKVWVPARRQVIDHDATPYALRHSCASLLLAAHKTVHYVANQLGHDPALTFSTYGHLMAEYAASDKIDVDTEIAAARAEAAEWEPPLPKPVRELGTRQIDVLTLAHLAGPAGRTFPAWNDRRAALALAERGLLEHVKGTGTRRHFVITDHGQQTHDQLVSSASVRSEFAPHDQGEPTQ